MKKLSLSSLALRFGAVALFVCLCTNFGQTQDPKEAPEYGTVNLKAGFDPDPVVVKVDAGGEVQTKLGGFDHWVGKKPDVRLNYTAGKYLLTLYVESDADTTLLVNLPDGKWIGNDDTNALNPQLTFGTPATGQYDIWIGTIKGGDKVFPPAKLFITEKKK